MKSKYFPWILFFFLLLTHLPLLVNNGVFWDDWTIYNMSVSGLRALFVGAGGPYMVQFHGFLLDFSNPGIIYRFAVFILWVIGTYTFYGTLKNFVELTREDCLLITLIFAASPFYAAKATMIALPGLLCYVLFLLAFLLFVQIQKRNNVLLRIISMTFFILSFATPSLFFFYLLVPLYLFYINRQELIRALIIHLIRRADFMALPILAWIVKSIYIEPSGWHAAGYNEIHLYRFLYVPLKFSVLLNETIFGLGAVLLDIYPYFSLLLFIIIVLLTFKISWLNSKLTVEENELAAKIFGAGFILFFIGAFPYLLVGRMPSFSDYNTRHQLLLQPGFAIMIYAGIIVLIRQRYRTLLYVSIILIFVTISITMQKQYLVGWFKQEAIIAHLKEKKEWRDFNTIEVIDYTENYNAAGRGLVFYEWNGIGKLVSGKEDKLFIPRDIFLEGKEYFFLGGLAYKKLSVFTDTLRDLNATEMMNMKDYYPSGNCNQIIIYETEKQMSTWQSVIKLTYLYYFKKDSFYKVIPDYVNVRFSSRCNDRVEHIL